MILGIDAATLGVIIGMALATYACRGGGYWLFSQIRPTPFIRTILGYIPGTLFVAYVVPALVSGGLQQWVGAATTAASMVASRNLSIAIIAGTAAAWAVWQFT